MLTIQKKLIKVLLYKNKPYHVHYPKETYPSTNTVRMTNEQK
jgi:hypothetical protein